MKDIERREDFKEEEVTGERYDEEAVWKSKEEYTQILKKRVSEIEAVINAHMLVVFTANRVSKTEFNIRSMND